LEGRWDLFVEPTGCPGTVNMAVDQALLERAAHSGTSTLRFYRFDPPCLSLGRHEPAVRRYDRSEIERRGLDVVRRPTGGRAVWHEHEVTYAVAAPLREFGGSMRAAYHSIHERIAAALRALGAEVTLAPDRPTAALSDRLTAASCFSSSVGGEVLAAGRKLVGSAQVRLGDAFLQHGSILLDGTQEMIRAVSVQPSPVSGATTLAAALGRSATFEEVAHAVAAVWGDSIHPASPCRPLPPLAAPFSSPSWTWRR